MELFWDPGGCWRSYFETLEAAGLAELAKAGLEFKKSIIIIKIKDFRKSSPKPLSLLRFSEVCVTKYYKLQGKLLAGSATVSRYHSRAPLSP